MDPVSVGLGIASIAGGLFGSKKASKAAKAQAAAQQAAINEQARQYDTTRADFAPWRQAGTNALAQLANPSQNFMASPDLEFRRSQGMQGIGNSFAARGGAFSGNALKALNEYNSNLASGEFGNWWNRQAGLAGVGQAATGSTAAAGANASGNISNLLAAQGDARASGITNSTNALLGGLGGLAGAVGGYFGGKGGSSYTSMSNDQLWSIINGG